MELDFHLGQPRNTHLAVEINKEALRLFVLFVESVAGVFEKLDDRSRDGGGRGGDRGGVMKRGGGRGGGRGGRPGLGARGGARVMIEPHRHPGTTKRFLVLRQVFLSHEEKRIY